MCSSFHTYTSLPLLLLLILSFIHHFLPFLFSPSSQLLSLIFFSLVLVFMYASVAVRQFLAHWSFRATEWYIPSIDKLQARGFNSRYLIHVAYTPAGSFLCLRHGIITPHLYAGTAEFKSRHKDRFFSPAGSF
jgi:hypothetical protein